MPSAEFPKVAILFCCTSNICRSPTAEGIFRKLVAAAGLHDVVLVDSAGTHDYHVGMPPDARSIRAALRRGYDLSELRARQVTRADFNRFDLVLAMDHPNHGRLSGLCEPEHTHKLKMMMSYGVRYSEIEVPDPYYGKVGGFDHVLDMLEDASAGLLASLILEKPGN
ncbi:MAG: low molecular weight phosphotyrosine protein phosphatase [Betaproteobacteria bacterium]|nr:low molecular weight phosphotyrosine protein phosphatase [Betaproteobacteria bacterium]